MHSGFPSFSALNLDFEVVFGPHQFAHSPLSRNSCFCPCFYQCKTCCSSPELAESLQQGEAQFNWVYSTESASAPLLLVSCCSFFSFQDWDLVYRFVVVFLCGGAISVVIGLKTCTVYEHLGHWYHACCQDLHVL